MNLFQAKADPDYIEARAATSEIEPPSVGFAAPSEFKEGTLKTLGGVIKQNNTILHLLIKQQQEVSQIRVSIQKLEEDIKSFGKRESKPLELEESISGLSKRLDKLSLGEKVPPVVKQGPIYYYKDPTDIFKKQYGKEKK